jgi:hypothetical protein
MDRDRSRNGEMDRHNRENQVPGVRRDDDASSDRSMGARDRSSSSDGSMEGRSRNDDAMQGAGPDRGGILNDHREGTTRNQTGSNVRDEHSRPTGSPADGA